MMIDNVQSFDFIYMRNGRQQMVPSAHDLNALAPYEHYFDHPESKALLLLHGFGSSPAVFRHFYPHLCHYRYIFAPRLHGHGRSILDFSQTQRQDWLSQVRDILHDLCQNYETVDVLGLSMGGLLAAYLCPHFPIHHLYLLAPALELFKPLSILQPLALGCKKFGFFAIRNQGGCVYKSDEAELAYRWLPINSILEILKLIEEFPKQPWKTPTTAFLGKYDAVVDSAKVAQILENLGPVNTIMLENSAHVLPIDGDYQTIIQTINFHNVAHPGHKTTTIP